MKKTFKYILYFFIVFTQLIEASHHKKTAFKDVMFDISSLDKATSKIIVSVKSKTIISGEIVMSLITSPLINKLQQSSNSIKKTKNFGILNKFQEFKNYYELIMPKNGYYIINIEVINKSLLKDNNSDSEEYSARTVYPIYIEMENGRVVGKDYIVPNKKFTNVPKKNYESPDNNKAEALSNSSYNLSKPGEQIRVYIKGKVLYHNNNRDQGIPDVTVRLDWDNDNNSTTSYTPYNGNNQLHVDYDKTDMEGNFYFNFSFSSSYPANHYSDKIRIYVTCSNSATFDGDLGYGAYFIDYKRLNIQNLSDNVFFPNENIFQTDINRASALRYHYRARKFSINELGFIPNTIRYYIRLNGSTSFFCVPGNCGGMNMNVPRIVYDQVPEDYGTAYHEYGHFIEWNKVGFLPSDPYNDPHWFQKVTEHITAWKEGWAEFYCAATYNYFNKIEMTSLPQQMGKVISIYGSIIHLFTYQMLIEEK